MRATARARMVELVMLVPGSSGRPEKRGCGWGDRTRPAMFRLSRASHHCAWESSGAPARIGRPKQIEGGGHARDRTHAGRHRCITAARDNRTSTGCRPGCDELLRHQRRLGQWRRPRRARRRRRALPGARRRRPARQRHLARLSQHAGDGRPAGRQRARPDRAGPVAERQGRGDRGERRRAARREQPHQGDRADREGRSRSTAAATARTCTTS